MQEPTSDQRATLFPFARYRDAATAIEWLCAAFGFETQMVVPGPDGTVAHAELKLGGGVFMLGSEREDEFAGIRSGVYVWVPDVDAHHERAKAAGAAILRPPADTDYGSREYAARDPEGHIWSFGSYYPEG